MSRRVIFTRTITINVELVDPTPEQEADTSAELENTSAVEAIEKHGVSGDSVEEQTLTGEDEDQ